MGIFDVFKKKKDDFELPKEIDMPMGEGLPSERPGLGDETGLESPSYGEGLPPMPAREPIPEPVKEPSISDMPPFRSTSPAPVNKDFDLVLAKLDAINAKLESLNTRVVHLERIASGEEEKSSREW